MLKASTGSSRSTAPLGEPMRAPDRASNWRGHSGLPRSPRIQRCPTCGVVEAHSLTSSFDDLQPRFDAILCRAKQLKSHYLLCHWKRLLRKLEKSGANPTTIAPGRHCLPPQRLHIFPASASGHFPVHASTVCLHRTSLSSARVIGGRESRA